MKPSDFKKAFPYSSVMRKTECEIVASNIMSILGRKGNEWRTLSWEEYKEERLKDGNFSYKEEVFFNKVIDYTTSPDKARSFSKGWGKITPDFIYKEELEI
jgi:hypothetical protein